MTSQARITVTAEDRASRVLQQVRGQLASTSASAGQLAASAGLIGPAFATLASAAGLVGFVKGVADAVDALNDVADATGASIENLSALERVARLNGGTLGDVSGVLVKFNAALAAAGNPASDAAGVFKALGLSAKELQQIDPAVALQRTAVALAGFADDGNKARITQELFGKSIKDAAPLLKDLAEAGKLNASVTREQAEQAERFNKSLYALQTTAADVGRNLVLGLGGALAELVERYKVAQQVFGGIGGIVSAGLKEKLNFADPTEGLRAYNAQLVVLDERIRKASDGTDGFNKRFSGPRVEALQKERAEIARVADYYRNLLNLGSAGQGRGNGSAALPSLPAVSKPTTPAKEEIDRSTEALGQYIAKLYKEAEAVTAVTEVQRAANALREAGAKGQLPAVRELVTRLAQEADARAEAAFFADVTARATEREAQAMNALDGQLDGFAGRTADALKQAQTARLEARLAAGEQFTDAELERIVKNIGGIKDAAQETFDASNKALERFASNVQDALGTTIEASLRGDFDNIGKLWSNLLLKMASEALAADLASALFGNLAAKPGAAVAGGGSGLFGQLFSSLFSFGIGRAAGGTVQPWSMQRVNESGPELFTSGGQDWLLAGSRGGTVTPNGALGGGGTIQVVQHITVGSQVSRNDVMAAMQVAKIQTVRAVADARRRTYAEGAA
jgi:hypothetical protein